MASCGPQREWSDQFKDKNKVVAWPQHNFEHFVVVVRSLSDERLKEFCMYVDVPISNESENLMQGLPPATEILPLESDLPTGPAGRRESLRITFSMSTCKHTFEKSMGADLPHPVLPQRPMKGRTQKALQGRNMHLAVPSQARRVKFSTKC